MAPTGGLPPGCAPRERRRAPARLDAQAARPRVPQVARPLPHQPPPSSLTSLPPPLPAADPASSSQDANITRGNRAHRSSTSPRRHQPRIRAMLRTLRHVEPCRATASTPPEHPRLRTCPPSGGSSGDSAASCRPRQCRNVCLMQPFLIPSFFSHTTPSKRPLIDARPTRHAMAPLHSTRPVVMKAMLPRVWQGDKRRRAECGAQREGKEEGRVKPTTRGGLAPGSGERQVCATRWEGRRSGRASVLALPLKRFRQPGTPPPRHSAGHFVPPPSALPHSQSLMGTAASSSTRISALPGSAASPPPRSSRTLCAARWRRRRLAAHSAAAPPPWRSAAACAPALLAASSRVRAAALKASGQRWCVARLQVPPRAMNPSLRG